MSAVDLSRLPEGLPVPSDDGAANHLVGIRAPAIALPATDGTVVRFDVAKGLWTVVFCYPRTGRPGAIAAGTIEAWNAIPGARGCTPHSCGYRDRYAELRALHAQVYGLSTQDTEYQLEAVERLHLPFPLLSDEKFELTRALGLPTFEFEGMTLLKRLTLVIRDGKIEHCFYPVFPPDKDAANVLAWLRSR